MLKSLYNKDPASMAGARAVGNGAQRAAFLVLLERDDGKRLSTPLYTNTAADGRHSHLWRRLWERSRLQ